MKRTLILFLVCCLSCSFAYSQNFGDLPKIEKEKLLNDLEILYQGLDKFHSGMYWYTPKDTVDKAFRDVRKKITKELNVLEFHKLIAPLVALSREDHTNIYLPSSVREKINSEIKLLPLTVVFLGGKLYCVKNGSSVQDVALEGKQIEAINGETPTSIVDKIGNLFASDGFIKTVKYSDLRGDRTVQEERPEKDMDPAETPETQNQRLDREQRHMLEGGESEEPDAGHRSVGEIL